MTTRKLLLVNYDGLTDALLLTAAVRDLQLNTFGGYEVDVHTVGMPIWQHNPHITRLDWRSVPYDGESPLAANEYGFPEHKSKIICYDTEIQVVPCSRRGYFAASEKLKHINAYHRIHGLAYDIAEKLGLNGPIPIGEMRGVITLSDLERSWVSQVEEKGNFNNFWIIVTGGKDTKSAQWWDVERYQRIVDEFRGKISFVQCGAGDEYHPRLEGVVDLVGKTDLRQIIRLMYHAGGFIGAPGFLMHLAAATPIRPFERNGRPKCNNRGAVIIGGGSEPYQWYAYEGQNALHTNGMLACCETGGCGKSRCEVRHRSDPKPEELCVNPVQIGGNRVIPRCLDMISTKMVIDRIKYFFDGGAFYYDDVPFESPFVVKEEKKDANEDEAPEQADA